MMNTELFRNTRWRWLNVDLEQADEMASLPILPEARISWMDSIHAGYIGSLGMHTAKPGHEAMWGMLHYQQDIHDHQNRSTIHYYLSADLLITNAIDFTLMHGLTKESMLSQLEHAESAIEGFMILLGEIVYSFNRDIDKFESRMHNLLWLVKEKNNEHVLERIVENRHELMIWKSLIIPATEIRDALQEAFGDEQTAGPAFSRTSRRMHRCREMLREYDHVLQEMIDLEVALSSHRGNEIVKTLTVITMLFTPVAAWGALWGMNFKYMPELDWKLGYPFSLFVIIFSTWALYYYLKKKNWTKSVLLTKKGKKF